MDAPQNNTGIPENLPDKKNYFKYFLFFLIFFILIVLFSGKKLDKPISIQIKSGDSLREIATEFEKNKIIFSDKLLLNFITLIGRDDEVVAGYYSFDSKSNFLTVTKRITTGDFKIEPIKITFPEGFTVSNMSDRLKERLPDFDEKTFMELSKNYGEGRFFPDTYFFLPNTEPSEIVKIMTSKNDQVITKTLGEFSSRDTIDIIIIASMVQKEVKKKEDMQIVAEIILNRLEIGMALQIDATLAYERGIDSLSLTTADLKTDSLYNSYTRRGLPPTPISNPGKDALISTKTAYTKDSKSRTKYLYFLTDSDGNVHYARTHDEHISNKNKYLR